MQGMAEGARGEELLLATPVISYRLPGSVV
jgi:hypothetical protein